jgi:hypothetical protein
MMVRTALPVPAAFVAEIGTAKVPVALTIPEMTPVVGFKLKPAGRLVAEKLAGPLDAVKV